MADYNQENRSRRNIQDWDQNRQQREGQQDQNRGYENINYNRQGSGGDQGNYNNPQNGGDWDNYRTRSLSSNMGNYNRANFIPDNDENRSDFEQQRYGNRGRYENRSSQGGWGAGNRMDYTNYGAGQFGRENDYQPGGYGRVGNTGSDYGRGEGSRMNRPDYDYRHGQAGANYGDYSTYGERFGGENQEYQRTNANRDRDWWDRTTDEVSSWFGDDDAERRRRMDKMTGPHKGKGPKGYSRSSERIREDVSDRLSEDSYVDASEIDVRVEGNDVILSGTVHSREEKRRAEDLAERISGVSNVQNQLKVERGSEQNREQNERNTGRNRSGWL